MKRAIKLQGKYQNHCTTDCTILTLRDLQPTRKYSENRSNSKAEQPLDDVEILSLKAQQAW